MNRKYLAAAAAAAIIAAVWFRGRSARKSSFYPEPELRCGSAEPPEYAVDTTGRGAEGTVVWGPRTPGINRSAPLHERFEGRPSQTPLAQLTRRTPTWQMTSAKCPLTLTDIETNMTLEGLGPEEGLSQVLCDATSVGDPGLAFGKRFGLAARTPAALRIGLGSVAMDPRFQPGTPYRYHEDNSGPAPGSHAGADTLGAFTPEKLATPGSWDATYVKSLGGIGTDREDEARTRPFDLVTTLSE